MNNKAPKHMIEQLPDGSLAATLPASVGSLDELERIPLYKLRDHIAALTCQGYALAVKKIFDTHPQIVSLSIENSDDYSDNGRHISFLITQCVDDFSTEEEIALGDKVSELADYLNNAVRDRSIYDFLDSFIALEELHADTFDEQVAKVYDETFQEPGAWMRLRANAAAEELDHNTPTSTGPTPRSRM